MKDFSGNPALVIRKVTEDNRDKHYVSNIYPIQMRRDFPGSTISAACAGYRLT
jgi:hypothetical protein